MKLWIRSQDKESLIQVDCLCIEKNEIDKEEYIYSSFDIVQGCITLGTYKTKERAIEILDEIQNKLNEPKNSYEDLVNKLKIFSETPIIKCDNNDNCNISLNIATLKDMIIYEMPKE